MSADIQLEFFLDPYMIRAERISYGQPGNIKFEWWWCVYRNDVLTIKFLQKSTAIKYVETCRKNPNGTPQTL